MNANRSPVLAAAPHGGALVVPRRRVLAMLAAALMGAAVDVDAATSRFDPSRDAALDVAAAIAQARAQGKRVLVDVGGEWCPWCHVMDRFLERDGEAARLRDAGFVWVKVNVSRENRNAAFLARWPKVAGYPHLFVLDDQGRLLHSQDTSELEAGKGYDRAKFIAFLRRWSPR